MTDGNSSKTEGTSFQQNSTPAQESPDSRNRRHTHTGVAPNLPHPRASKRASLYERLKYDLEHDPKVAQEISLGKRLGFYKMRGQLGAGNFAKVKLGMHLLTHEKVAIKIIDKTKLDDIARRILSREITCMEWLDHPSIIRLFEVIESFSTLHLVMEFAGEGDLQARIINEGPMTENQGRHIFAQVTSAINHMHRKGVVHRDLKAENVFFFSATQIKVGDFGFSTQTTGNLLDTFCGSPPYAAPELFNDDHYYGHMVDIWAMGVMLYYMLSGSLPFRGDTIPQLKAEIIKAEFKMPENLTPVCKELISGLLTKNVDNRYTMDEIYSNMWLRTGSTAKSLDVTGDGGSFDVKGVGVGLMLPASGDALDASFNAGNDRVVDDECIQSLKKIGMPISNVEDLVGEPRNPMAGAYRILLHRKHLKQLAAGESSENVAGQSNTDDRGAITTARTSGQNSAPNDNSCGTGTKSKSNSRGSHQQKSKFCVIF